MTQQNLVLLVDVLLSNFGHLPGTSDAIAIGVIVLPRYQHVHRGFNAEQRGGVCDDGGEPGSAERWSGAS